MSKLYKLLNSSVTFGEESHQQSLYCNPIEKASIWICLLWSFLCFYTVDLHFNMLLTVLDICDKVNQMNFGFMKMIVILNHLKMDLATSMYTQKRKCCLNRYFHVCLKMQAFITRSYLSSEFSNFCE